MSERPCAFHPDRLTAVSCSRCDRPICPEDMIDAPVGIHCPVCSGRMREGALGAATYRARVRAQRLPGARVIARGSVTRAILAVNIVVFVLMLLSGAATSTATLLRFGALPPVLPRGEWWRLLTAMFVHIGMLHLFFNMFALNLFGPSIEERYGKAKFLVLYLLSGVFGSAVSIAFSPPSGGAGASGAVFGILGAWIAFFVRHRRLPGASEQLRSLLALVAINVVIGLTIPRIDNLAHLGGLAAGFVAGMVLEVAARRPPGPRAVATLSVFAGLAVIAVALVASRMVP